MKNNNISTITSQQTITSMEIAEITGKNHFDVLKAIRKMEPAWEKTAASKFTCSSYKDKSNKSCPMFILTKTECLFVATKFNDVARAKLVLRWEELEKERLQGLQSQPVTQNDTPSTLPADPSQLTRKQLLLMALEAEEEKEKLQGQVNELEAENYGLMLESGQKDQQIQQLKERTAYLSVIMSDNTSVTVSQIAQDYGMSGVAFNNLLKGLRIQRAVGGQWLLYSDYQNKGYVTTRMIPIHHSGAPDTFKPLTTWTQAGRKFIYEKLKKHGVLPVIERTQAEKGCIQ